MQTKRVDFSTPEFRGQLPEEDLICVFRNHWVSILPSIILTVILLVSIALFGIFTPATLEVAAVEENSPIAGFGLMVAVFGLSFFTHTFFLSIFHYYLRYTILTNLRLITINKSIYKIDLKDSVELDQIQDISKIQDTISANILDYGSINMTVIGVDEARKLDYVPKPDYYFKKLNEAKAEFQGHKDTMQDEVKNENQQ